MSEPVKPRSYDSSRRRAAARQTRRAIIAAANRCFIAQGYAGTTMAAIAEEAGVAIDTIYATIGTKAVLFRLLVETAISGEDVAVPALQRQYVQAMRAEPDARKKLEMYAAAIRDIQSRLAPLFRVLSQAAPAEEDLADLWREISERRAANMRLLAVELHATGAVRADLRPDETADIIWATNSPDLYALLVFDRGWSPDHFERWLADAWIRLLLDELPPP